jgi:hypothetical protein
MIPDMAVESAREALQRYKQGKSMHNDTDAVEAILTAAAPFIAAQAWDEGHGHCFHVENPDRKDRNPYRS